MAVQDDKKLTGAKKASMLLLALGASQSAQVLRHLSESEIEKLSTEMVHMRQVDPVMTRLVLAEFEKTSTAVPSGAGREFAARVLDQVLGPEKTKHVLQKAARTGGEPFEFLYDADSSVITGLLSDEQPQIGALVLVNLPPEKAASVLSELPVDLQSETARCICAMGEVDPEAIPAIEEALKAKLKTVGTKRTSFGPETLVQILNNSGPSTERLILDALRKDDPSVGNQVRQMMFVFEDLLRVSERDMQTLLRKIDFDDLHLALSAADEEIKEHFFRCMSERAGEMLKEEIEMAGPIRIKDAETAQQRIVTIVRRLIATGDISLTVMEEEFVA